MGGRWNVIPVYSDIWKVYRLMDPKDPDEEGNRIYYDEAYSNYRMARERADLLNITEGGNDE